MANKDLLKKTVKYKNRFGKEVTGKVRSMHEDRKGKLVHLIVSKSEGGYDEVPAGKYTVVK